MELFEKALVEGKIVIKSEIVNDYWNICRTSVEINGNIVCVKDGSYSPLRGNSEYI